MIRVLDVIENETHIYIATETVTPLSWHVKRKSLGGEIIKWGLHSVSSTLKFINNEAASVHGNIRVSSVYTSESGEWKLAGFEVLSSMNEDDAIIYSNGNLVPDSNRYAPPEVTANGWAVIKRSPLYAADAFGLGILTSEAFSGGFTSTDQLSSARGVPSNMVQPYKRLINNNPKLRLSAGHFVEQGKKSGGFFETPLIHITEGVESLGLKNEEERNQFLDELGKVTDDFPEDFFKAKVLPELLKSVEFGGGGPKVFGAIIRIGSKLSEDEYEAKLTPLILRLFASPDRAMRVCLLDNLPQMIDRLSQKDVNNKIFPLIVTGFSDTAPIVREQTVKSVLTLINKLSERTINGDLLRHLAKTANDEQPGIRTNTTICLGKIARNLGTGSRSKVLIAAFTRSLRDPFMHARNAALMAFGATSDVFSNEDCAGKILPALSASLIDKEKFVRDSASKTFDLYLSKVKKYASTLPDTAGLVEPDKNASSNPAQARIGGQGDTSWAGWAISSFTNKTSSAKGDMTSAPPQEQAIAQIISLPASGRVTPNVTAAAPSRTVVPTQATNASEKFDSTVNNEDLEIEDDIMDAWGDMDDDGDNFFDAPATKKAMATAPVDDFNDHGEPDFAGWLAAQNKSKSARPLAKGLGKATNGASPGPRSGPTRSISSGPVTTADKKVVPVLTRKALSPASRKIDLKPKPVVNDEDDWGAWD